MILAVCVSCDVCCQVIVVKFMLVWVLSSLIDNVASVLWYLLFVLLQICPSVLLC